MALMGHINLHRGNEKARFDFHQNELFSVPDGGDKRDRTADLLNAIQALSRTVQSHTPMPQVYVSLLCGSQAEMSSPIKNCSTLIANLIFSS